MVFSLNHIISEVQRKENAISLSAPNIIDEAHQMTIYLKEYLWSIREDIIKQGFKNHWEEINFFRNIKPYILSKLIYHNKIFRIQTACPVDGGKMYASYFAEQLQELQREYREHIYNSDFYRYYRSGRTDRDETYFRLGNINFHDGAYRKFKRPFRAVCWVGGGRASPVLGTDRTSVSGISASRGHAAALSAAMLR
ncbi:RteC domain-containing protein [Escherichia coli]|uniref:RteC domain-containing protein n=1 Tax=Escherichia coli TaxID=562 RepID=UPI001BFCB897|nr:RteC domain-containing protein [Escherichia coli]